MCKIVLNNEINTNETTSPTPLQDPIENREPEISILTDIFKAVLWEGGKTVVNEIAIPYVATLLDHKNTPFEHIGYAITSIQVLSGGYFLTKLIWKNETSATKRVEDALYHGLSIFRYERVRTALITPYLK